jgi:hypothetical protein
MKTAFLLLTSSLVIAASGAFAQGNTDACHSQYASCVERCSTRPKSLQESCSNTCESTTNQCYAGMYGSSKSAAQAIQSTPDQASAQEPEARDEAKIAPKADAKPKKKKK